MASLQGHEAVVRFLLAKGASESSTDKVIAYGYRFLGVPWNTLSFHHPLYPELIVVFLLEEHIEGNALMFVHIWVFNLQVPPEKRWCWNRLQHSNTACKAAYTRVVIHFFLIICIALDGSLLVYRLIPCAWVEFIKEMEPVHTADAHFTKAKCFIAGQILHLRSFPHVGELIWTKVSMTSKYVLTCQRWDMLQDWRVLCLTLASHEASELGPPHLPFLMHPYQYFCGICWCDQQDGWTPLHQAASHGHLSVANLLVRASANVSTVTKVGEMRHVVWLCM